MANLMGNLAGIGRDPQMANRIVQALIESTRGSGGPAQLPPAPAQPGPPSSNAKLMSPDDLSFMERLFRGEEMPFDIGGSTKVVGVTKRLHQLEKKMLDFFGDLKSERTGFILSDGRRIPYLEDSRFGGGHDGMAQSIGVPLRKFLDDTSSIRVMEHAQDDVLALLAQGVPSPSQVRSIAKDFKEGGFNRIDLDLTLPGQKTSSNFHQFNSVGDLQRFLREVGQ